MEVKRVVNPYLPAICFVLVSLVSVQPATSQALFDALVTTYSNNPTLNAARAAQRAQNEAVSQAKSGRRPTVTGTSSIGAQSTRSFFSGGFGISQNNDVAIGSANVTLTQNVFNGFQNANNIKSAEAGVRAGLSNLENTEQIILQQAVTAYADVFRDRQIVILQERNVEFSREQLRAARAQAQVGEGTRTDVALAQANVADSLSSLAASRSNLVTSEATYRQIIGQTPAKLSAIQGVTKRLPITLERALNIADKEHPLIKAAQHNVDAGQFNLKVSEGTLLPSLTLNGTYQRDFQTGTQDSNGDTGTLTANLTVPFYQGGARFSTIRQARQTVSQLRIQVDETRRLIDQAVRAAWGTLEASSSQIEAARTNVRASQTALDGLVEQRRLGEATTLDVVNAQASLITAQITLENAIRDSTVASYAVLQSIGDLTGSKLNLTKSTDVRSPTFHYKIVRDRWVGLRAPGGK